MKNLGANRPGHDSILNQASENRGSIVDTAEQTYFSRLTLFRVQICRTKRKLFFLIDTQFSCPYLQNGEKFG